MVKKIIALFAAWRLLLFLPLWWGYLWLPYRKGYEYTLLTYFTKADNPINHFLLSPWGNFDGIYYLLIAAKGYTVNAGFFPLFPLILNRLASLFGELLPFDPHQYLLAQVLVTVFTLAGLLIFYALIKLDFDSAVTIQSLLFLLIFPTAFFLVSIYTESLFFLLAVLAFYCMRKKWWIAAGIVGGLLTATRPVGIAIFPALLYEIWGDRSADNRLSKIIAILLAPTGLLAYMWFNLHRWGNALYFIQAQGNLQNNRSVLNIIPIPQTLFRYFHILTVVTWSHYEWWVALLELTVFLFTAVFLLMGWTQRIRRSYLLFSLIAFLLPTSTGTFSGLPRYVLVLFPLFIALALTKHSTTKALYVTISVFLLFLLLMLFSKGYFVA